LAALPDVNALIALLDADHVGHSAITRWFRQHHKTGWANCPLTENGLVRVLSQSAYPSGRRTPAEVVEVLGALKSAFSPSHQFWPDDLSLADVSIFDSLPCLPDRDKSPMLICSG
jgi:predicted nucleic acid-binding protein